jgi:pimeloyl-ACP methyl ester carboxylesterase
MLAFDSQGSGSPVVFLHGFCESKAIWTDFIPLLPQNHQYLSIDLPGFGESLANTNYQSMEAMAEEVYDLLTNQHIGKAIFICHSLGAYVALALAEKYPELFAGLCLFHSSAFADSEERKLSRNKTADFIDKKGLEVFLESFVPSLFYKNRREELASEIEKVKQICLKTPKQTAVSVTLAMRDRPDRTHVLANADFPVSFIMGKADELAVLEPNKPQFFLPKQAAIYLLAETAHMGMYERPQETAKMLSGFLNLC